MKTSTMKFLVTLFIFYFLIYSEEAHANSTYNYLIFPSNEAQIADQTPMISLDIDAPSYTVEMITLFVDGKRVHGKYHSDLQKFIYEPYIKLDHGKHSISFTYNFKGYLPQTMTSTFYIVKQAVDPFQNKDKHILLEVEKDGLEKLNELRNALGLPLFSINDSLRDSAQAHSNYLNLGRIDTGHYEYKNELGFTGHFVSERSTYYGYDGLTVGEGITYDWLKASLAVEDLMDAPYHRLSIINPNYTEVGIGHNFEHHNVNATVLNYGGKAITNDDVVVYPYPGQTNTKLGWYVAENPNPLESYGLDRIYVGYPISISVHDIHTVELQTESAVLRDEDGNEIPFFMVDSSKETNQKQHLFLLPKKPFKPGKTYEVEANLIRVMNSGEKEKITKKWSFTTMSKPLVSDIFMLQAPNGLQYVKVELKNGDLEDMNFSIKKEDGTLLQTFNSDGDRYYRSYDRLQDGTYNLTVKSAAFSAPLQMTIRIYDNSVQWKDVQKLNEKKIVNYPSKDNISPFKDWTITFNTALNADSLSLENLYVTDLEGNLISVKVSKGTKENEVIVTAPEGGYSRGETYALYISNFIQSESGEKMKETKRMEFTIEN